MAYGPPQKRQRKKADESPPTAQREREKENVKLLAFNSMIFIQWLTDGPFMANNK